MHDSQAFLALFEQLKRFQSDYLIADAGYKTPSIAKFLLDQNITPVFSYTRPRGKKGKLSPKDFIYEEYYDCYLCPENHVLAYSTTNRDGYREYKSDPKICANCPLLSSYTESKKKQKILTRHIWRDYLEICEEIRHQKGSKELYQKRKESVERLFGTAKEYHNLRYTREVGKSKMKAKVGLTLACLNIKKLIKVMAGKPFYFSLKTILIKILAYFENSNAEDIKKTNIKTMFVFNLKQRQIRCFFGDKGLLSQTLFAKITISS